VVIAHLVGDGGGKDGGDLVGGKGEASASGGERGGKLRVFSRMSCAAIILNFPARAQMLRMLSWVPLIHWFNRS